MDLPLNALRAFQVSARHLSFTRAADELNLTQSAVSQHVKNLESRLGVSLFRRVPRGLVLTDEGVALLPVLSESFNRIETALAGYRGTVPKQVLSVGVVGTFAVGWLLPRIHDFQAQHPHIELRLSSNNNRVDLAAEGLDFAIRFGDGNWHGVDARPLLSAPLSLVCSPTAARRLRTPRDTLFEPLLRSYRPDEWPAWFKAAELEPPVLTGSMFDSSMVLADAVAQGAGVALLPVRLFERELLSGRLCRPFALEVDMGRYWLTRIASRREDEAMLAFSSWILRQST
ncbi:LysR family transcriptional regulator [Pollutimonas harenae]|uniref:LysR family transcriptional regulator n=1 Tax=Pollutimonas harenae TaxID=657015 RepID=A0A853GWV0_9BURK|nr:LysR family transcriptional regulator [Pollutimonas harenae]NYT85226.1 LysR family transcriptional regulator [Pollutimonas harenae]TEA72403.1 LysR family transcriptional regulator [Pollutimonas harenae]